MSRTKVQSEDYINFIIASPDQATATEASRCQPRSEEPTAHDAFTRLLNRLEPDPSVLWEEAKPQVDLKSGVLIIDDSVLDKPYAEKIELVRYFWSGKHHKTVKGIDLVSLLWTDGERHIPCDYKIYDKAEGKTKNDYFQEMLRTAHQRGFKPQCVLFDSWFGSVENLKTVRSFDWIWLTQLKSNRLINPDNKGNRAVSEVDLPETGQIVHLKGYGFIKVFRIVSKKGDTEYWATNDLKMTDLQRLSFAEQSWKIEEYHRGIKQVTLIECCQARSKRAQSNHIGMALRAFLRFELWSFRTGVGWLNLKWDIVREAIRNFLSNPRYVLT
jgi:hypothetical protein